MDPKVYLVGAGPGDPGLLTLRAAELIAAADVIVYDRLIPATALASSKPSAELIYVGKEADRQTLSQDKINRLLVEKAQAGLVVVRLKGGDPFVFGRGGEEALALHGAGIGFEIVPGVTAGVAAAAYAGIPVTDRESSSAVAFITGHSQEDGDSIEWQAVANFPGTLVFYMGVRNLAEIVQNLLVAGRNGSEPAAVIERGTSAAQRTVSGTLAEIAELANSAAIEPPALTVIGKVVELREQISWFENRPLFGTKVVVTRAQAQASKLSKRLSVLGADVIETPVISIEPLSKSATAETLKQVSEFGLICFTSINGVERFFAELSALGLDSRALAGAEIAAVGQSTATALVDRGIIADTVPDRATSDELAKTLSKTDLKDKRVLVATAEGAAEILERSLLGQGADVTVLDLYRTEAASFDDATADKVCSSDYVTFSSGSTVRNLLTALEPKRLPANCRIVTIGPVTSEAVQSAGLRVATEAKRPDIDALVEAVLELAT